MNSVVARLTGLPPLIDTSVEILILGSFPSPASLAAQQYYAHRQNQFWRIMGAVVGEPLSAMDYDEKTRALLRRRIGVWDVFHSCRREGALDAAIRDVEMNDLSELRLFAPRLARVCFNGKTSARAASLISALGVEICVLPSTSPAYTLPFEQKLEHWQRAIRPSGV